MGQALYRKYRSRSLDEIVGQEHITNTLKQALKRGRISHAYLFTGPKGVGKTSIARILAHEINDLPYKDDSNHIDIIEIDAASNRRIDEIRELRERVHVAPTSAKYKVYIIDEVHMLTKEAFNALLKTLEEPPAHVVFILATTDAHKLPETIISRTQRFNFRPGEPAKVKAHLQDIAQQESIKIDEASLELLAQHGEGSFRDSVSLLDQAAAQGSKLGVDEVQRLLGIPPQDALARLVESLSTKASTVDIMQQLQVLYDQGFQASMIAKQLSSLLRGQLTGPASLSSTQILKLLKKLVEVPAAYDPARYLEIVLLESSVPSNSSAPAVLPEEPVLTVNMTASEPVKIDQLPVSDTNNIRLDEAAWPEVLAALKQKHNTLYGIVRMAQPSFDKDTVKLTFAFAFHQKRGNEPENRQRLADIIHELTGRKVIIECHLDTKVKPPKLPAIAKKEPKNQNLSTISNIFGNAELLES